MTARSSPQALCQRSNRFLSTCPSAEARRAFSSSSARRKHGAVPTFHPTPSTELSTLLSAIRTKIFLPAHLKRPQQNLIYQSRHRALLESEPFEVEVGSADEPENFLLQPIDRTKDVPNSWRSLRQAMDLMGRAQGSPVNAGVAKRRAKEKGKVDKKRQAQEGEAEVREASRQGAKKNEFDNLVPLLTGLRIAGRKWKPWQWEVIARMAGEKGAPFALLDAARQAESTGLYLYDLRIVREIMWACRLHAVHNGWSSDSCTKALAYIEEFANTMKDPIQKEEQKKAIHKGLLDDQVDTLKQPDVIGVAFEVAVQRVRALSREDADEEAIAEAQTKMNDYLERLLPNMDSAVDESGKALAQAKPLGMIADYELLRWVPVLNGLKLTHEGSPADAEEIRAATEKLSKTVSDAKAAVIDTVGGDEGGKRRGLIWCKDAKAL